MISNKLDSTDWRHYADAFQARHLFVLDNDLRAAQFALGDFGEFAARYVDGDTTTLARCVDCGARFANAVTRAAKMFKVISGLEAFRFASAQIATQLSLHHETLAIYRRARNRIEHSDEEAQQMPALVFEGALRSRAFLPVGAAVVVSDSILEVLIAIREAIVAELRDQWATKSSAAAPWLDGSKARVFCIVCVRRYHLAYLAVPEGDSKALHQEFLDTPCPHCGEVPRALGMEIFFERADR